MTAPPRKTTFEHIDEAGDLSSQTYGTWPMWKHTIPFPTPVMMGTSGTHQLETYLVVGSAWAQMLSHYLPMGAQVLDIGCGCAKLARFLASDARVAGYIGFDPIASCIAWNQRFVLPLTGPRFRFEHIDLYSAEYNPRGTVDPDRFVFPADDASIDLAVASSLFTHLLEPSACRYLEQSRRVLKPGGKLVLSLHTEPPAGQRFAGDEARIDVDPDYFVQLAAARGLRLHEALGSFCGQDVFVFVADAA